MPATLDFLSGSIRGRSIDVGDRPLLIGREATCQVVLAETKVSREHARIVLEQADYFLEDFNSTNGTFVNGNPVNRRRQLHHNDQIHFADVLCVFRTTRDDESASSFENFQATLPLTMESAEQLPEILNAVNSGSDSKIDVNAHEKLRAVLEMIRRLGNSLQVDTLLSNVLEGFFAVFPQTERGYVLFPEGPQEPDWRCATPGSESTGHPTRWR